jgi:hypothetical protein
VESPGQRADEEARVYDARRGGDAEGNRQPEAVQQVVEAHGAGVQPAALQARRHPVDEREVGAEPERSKLPVAGAVPHREEYGNGHEHDGQRREREAPDRIAECEDRARHAWISSFGINLTALGRS